MRRFGGGLLFVAIACGVAAAADGYDPDLAAARIATILAGLGDDRLQSAHKVFTGVTIAPTTSAERYLRIMDEGFAKSLGVDCIHCHDPQNWARDAQRKFAITRGMWDMVYRINQDHLRKIEGIDRKARINCTTCHRGRTTPAVTMD